MCTFAFSWRKNTLFLDKSEWFYLCLGSSGAIIKHNCLRVLFDLFIKILLKTTCCQQLPGRFHLLQFRFACINSLLRLLFCDWSVVMDPCFNVETRQYWDEKVINLTLNRLLDFVYSPLRANTASVLMIFFSRLNFSCRAETPWTMGYACGLNIFLQFYSSIIQQHIVDVAYRIHRSRLHWTGCSSLEGVRPRFKSFIQLIIIQLRFN